MNVYENHTDGRFFVLTCMIPGPPETRASCVHLACFIETSIEL